ncbi:MAG: EcsC family protein [Xanthomonadaceae bacterium]|nr:EcsC family protein [Xanthomonadaceae bacterium]
MSFTQKQSRELESARHVLEHPGLAARIGDLVGTPIERGFELLPPNWNKAVNEATRKSVEKAFDFALSTLDPDSARPPSNRWHKVSAGTSGALGGAFGLAALAVELPISTTIMLRSIADIARSQGEDLSTPEARLQCIQVLALGGPSKNDDAAEAGYFAARAGLAKAVSDAASHLASKGLSSSFHDPKARTYPRVRRGPTSIPKTLICG